MGYVVIGILITKPQPINRALRLLEWVLQESRPLTALKLGSTQIIELYGLM